MRNNFISGSITTLLLVAAVAAYSFATNRLAYNPEVFVISSMDRESCTHAQDEVDCLMRVSEARR